MASFLEAPSSKASAPVRRNKWSELAHKQQPIATIMFHDRIKKPNHSYLISIIVVSTMGIEQYISSGKFKTYTRKRPESADVVYLDPVF